MVILWVMILNNTVYQRLLVGGWALSIWKMMEWKSIGMMKLPIWWKNKPNVPNHQPDHGFWLITSELLWILVHYRWIIVDYGLDSIMMDIIIWIDNDMNDS